MDDSDLEGRQKARIRALGPIKSEFNAVMSRTLRLNQREGSTDRPGMAEGSRDELKGRIARLRAALDELERLI